MHASQVGSDNEQSIPIAIVVRKQPGGDGRRVGQHQEVSKLAKD
jgi:hypothetical protein